MFGPENLEEAKRENCGHDWQEVYYGYECKNCKAFIPFGCEPWAPEEEMLAQDDADDCAP